jgi:hypothetical protein
MSDGKTRIDGWVFQILAALMEAQQNGSPLLDKPTSGEVRTKLIQHTNTKPLHFIESGLERLLDCELAFKVLGSATPTYTVTERGETIAKSLLKLPHVWGTDFREGYYTRDVIQAVLDAHKDWLTVSELVSRTGISESQIRKTCRELLVLNKVERGSAPKGVGGRLIDQFRAPGIMAGVSFQMTPTSSTPPVVAPITQDWHQDSEVDDVVAAVVAKVTEKETPKVEFPDVDAVLEPDKEEEDANLDGSDLYTNPIGCTTVVLNVPDELYHRLEAVADILGAEIEDVLITLAENLVSQTRASIANDLTPMDSSKF